LPGFIYAMLARLAHAAQPDLTAQVRLQADDTWELVRVAPLLARKSTADTPSPCRAHPQPTSPAWLKRAWNLTSRERDVAALIIEDRSSDDIAACLFLSPHTVRDHIKAIFGKVGVHNRRHLPLPSPGQPGEATA
jgi:DNA-binding CsgD family transcriptional regulator